MWNRLDAACARHARAFSVRAPRILSRLVMLAAFRFVMLAALTCAFSGHARAQAAGSGIGSIAGDLKVDDKRAEGIQPLAFDVILYYLDGRIHSRQKVSSGGRYRFFNVRQGEYDLAVELDSQEVARLRLNVGSSGLVQDIELEWKGGGPHARTATVSVADFYERGTAARGSFEKAQAALDRKDYAQALPLLKQLTDADPKDFQALTEMGTAYLLQDKQDDAEKAYQRAVEARPTFFLALLNLGRLRASRKRFDEAIEPLTRAVEVRPASAEANLLLGEAYLQIKKGSKAVPHLEEAARLGLPEAHLRLATLYNAVGMKDRAAAEYEHFLAARPDSPERKKLEQYIKENKKQ